MDRKEEWRDISNYDGRYQVSNLGRVRSTPYEIYQVNRWGYVAKRRFRGKILSPIEHGDGYQYVSLRFNKNRKNHFIHRLVADAFVPGRFPLAVVDHKDGYKENNTAENLEWVSQRENVIRAVPKMCKPRKCATTSSTGEKYIYRRRGLYRLSIKGKIDRSFSSLSAAITAREVVLHGG